MPSPTEFIPDAHDETQGSSQFHGPRHRTDLGHLAVPSAEPAADLPLSSLREQCREDRRLSRGSLKPPLRIHIRFDGRSR